MIRTHNHDNLLIKTGSFWATDGTTHGCEPWYLCYSLGVLGGSQSAASWLVHKNHGSFQPTDNTPLLSFPLPGCWDFSFLVSMSPFVFLVSLAIIATPHLVRAQTPTTTTSSAFTPLASKSFDWNNLVRFVFCQRARV